MYAPAAALLLMERIVAAQPDGWAATEDGERLVVGLYHQEGRNLVRLARLFVDNVDAAEDIVQEAFIRLARHAHRVEPARSPAYLRSIVLNLARDHNRRGLVSLRHLASAGRDIDVTEEDDVLVRDERQRAVLDAVRNLPRRQRDCVALRYYDGLGVEAISEALQLSVNSVKTHLKRGLANLGSALGEVEP
ncbi:MAG TPA: sigma-70 family RNA polymerase sigma factor [Acidimicrobiales bacterium]